jgi:hypothetical protein
MNLCNDGHDEVCYEDRSCPVCEKQKELNAANEEIANLEKQVEELNQSE